MYKVNSKPYFNRLMTTFMTLICAGCLSTAAIAQSNQAIMKSTRDIKFVSSAQTALPTDGLTQSQANSRLALVIGNSRYRHISKLNNPENDAQDMTDSLKRLGFTVIAVQNSDHQSMVRAVESFGERLKADKGVGLFYYAGHGVQVAGQNYLLPIDAKISKPSDIRFETMNVAQILAEMAAANNRLNIVILDACRDNPFAGAFRQVSRGLAQVNAPSGTLLAYATAPGDVAADGSGRNGIYTKHLLNYLDKPGLTIEALFKKVRQGVIKATDKRQVPWESSSLLGEFFFVANSKPVSHGDKTAPQAQPLCALPQIDQRPISCLFGGL